MATTMSANDVYTSFLLTKWLNSMNHRQHTSKVNCFSVNTDLWDMGDAKEIKRITDGSYSPISIINLLKPNLV
jgi:hypothetical protein